MSEKISEIEISLELLKLRHWVVCCIITPSCSE